MFWRESLDAVVVLILNNTSKRCTWHDIVQRIFHRPNEEKKDKSENGKISWSKNCIWSLWDANSKAAVLHALQQRAELFHSVFYVSSIHPTTLSVITKRKHFSHYENPGSGKKASVMIQPGSSWWRIHARVAMAFVFWISAFFSWLPCMGSALPNCTFTSVAQELTTIPNFCWLTLSHVHRKITLNHCSHRFLLQLIYSLTSFRYYESKIPQPKLLLKCRIFATPKYIWFLGPYGLLEVIHSQCKSTDLQTQWVSSDPLLSLCDTCPRDQLQVMSVNFRTV